MLCPWVYIRLKIITLPVSTLFSKGNVRYVNDMSQNLFSISLRQITHYRQIGLNKSMNCILFEKFYKRRYTRNIYFLKKNNADVNSNDDLIHDIGFLGQHLETLMLRNF